MNNRFKFRIWDKTQKDFYIDAYMLRTDGIIFVEHKELIFNVSQENFVIQQYTGLKDKNDKEIYEGDIISITGWLIGSYFNIAIHSSMPETSYTWTAKVIYDEDYGAYLLEYINRPDYKGRGSFCGVGKNAEVIGNIFENPELLAEKSLDETQIP